MIATKPYFELAFTLRFSQNDFISRIILSHIFVYFLYSIYFLVL
jgi:hypothetical protein